MKKQKESESESEKLFLSHLRSSLIDINTYYSPNKLKLRIKGN